MPTDCPEIVRLTVKGTYDGEQCVNVFHFWKRDDTAVTNSDLSSLLAILDDAATDADSLAKFYNNQDEALSVTSAYFRTLSNAQPRELLGVVNAPGTATGTGGPPMLSCLIKWGTDVATRSGRGRTYLPGITVGTISTTDADQFTSAYRTAIGNMVNAWVGAWMANATWGFVVLSDKDRQANLASPYREVLSGSVDPIIRIQRRRRQGS